jgi:uncharacterized ion transporter superfamily protein YfcC
MHEREGRAYGLLDIVTKPLQWIIGGIQIILLLLIVGGVGLPDVLYQLNC